MQFTFSTSTKLFVFLLIILGLLNFVQAYTTGLLFDEAYYWYYAQQLEWGYFDHPPMVAWLIACSSFIQGELGVRLVFIGLYLGSIGLLYHTLQIDTRIKPLYFLGLLLCFPLFQYYGFLALPDSPFLFFTALFFWAYRRFLIQEDYIITFVLGLSMAGMMYSKYYGFLLILGVLFSNLSLLKNKKAWLALISSFLIYVPHLMWQIQTDFESLLFHLNERPNHAYNFSEFTLGYFLNMLTVFGLMGVLIFPLSIKEPKTDLFKKATSYAALLVVCFFFLSSFSKKTQAQWFLPIVIPIFLLTYQSAEHKLKQKKYLRILLLSNIIILGVGRMFLAFENLSPVPLEMHGHSKWVNALAQKADNKPVLFKNSYQRASIYQFYSGQKASSLNEIRYRNNQYGLRGYAEFRSAKDVILVEKTNEKAFDSIAYKDNSLFYLKHLQQPRIYGKLEWNFENSILTLQNKHPFSIPLQNFEIKLARLNAYKEFLGVKTVSGFYLQEAIIEPGQTLEVNTRFLQNIEPSPFFKLSLTFDGLPTNIQGLSLKNQ
tara:strand:+ start:19413 stop:21044 length:1632 start_codon:yes stop_codon:yes gene_type:complete